MNILVIGYGSIARKHVQALRSLNIIFKIYALRSKKRANVEDDITNIYDLSELTIKVDFAIISNPTVLHYKFISQVAETFTPLFIEKPPLSILEGSSELLAKVQKLRIKTYIACNLRFHPCIKFIKKYLSEDSTNRINEVNIYCGSFLPGWRLGQDFRKSYSANADMGGGVHLDLFHEIDYSHWLFGRPMHSQCVKRSKSSLNIDSYDYANYILEYEGFAVSIILNYYRKDPRRNIEIVFEDDTWNIDLIQNRIVSVKQGTVYSDTFAMADTYKDQMRYFIDNLKGAQPDLNTLEESLDVLKTCLL